MTTPETALVPISRAQRALALALESGDLAQLRDVAAVGHALQRGARARGMGIEAENQAAEVVIRAERALGEVLLNVPRSKTGPPKGTPKGSTSKASPTPFEEAVAAVGGNLKGVHEWQKLATIPDETFERMLTDIKGATERIARVKFLAKARPTEEAAEAARLRAYNASVQAATVDATSPLVARWVKATVALDNALDTLPSDDLAIVATRLMALATRYNAVKAGRS